MSTGFMAHTHGPCPGITWHPAICAWRIFSNRYIPRADTWSVLQAIQTLMREELAPLLADRPERESLGNAFAVWMITGLWEFLPNWYTGSGPARPFGHHMGILGAREHDL